MKMVIQCIKHIQMYLASCNTTHPSIAHISDHHVYLGLVRSG